MTRPSPTVVFEALMGAFTLSTFLSAVAYFGIDHYYGTVVKVDPWGEILGATGTVVAWGFPLIVTVTVWYSIRGVETR